MTNVGDQFRCPRCGGKARVVWVSQDGKTVAIKCMGYHSHDDYKTKPKKKSVKGMVFLFEATKNERKLLCLHDLRAHSDSAKVDESRIVCP